MLQRGGYEIKILNTINFKQSMRYNPFKYIYCENDILKLVSCIMDNTKGEDGKNSGDFWEKAEALYYQCESRVENKCSESGCNATKEMKKET